MVATAIWVNGEVHIVNKGSAGKFLQFADQHSSQKIGKFTDYVLLSYCSRILLFC